MFGRYKSEEEAVIQCQLNCHGPDKCPFQGMIRYQLSDEGIIKYQLSPADAGMIFTAACGLYQDWTWKIARTERAKDILGPSYFEYTFDNFDPSENPKAFETAKKYVENGAWKVGGQLILSGPYGVGKTHLLSSILHDAILQGAYAAFVNFAEVSTLPMQEAKANISRLLRYELIGIDDFGVEASQNWLLPSIFALFNQISLHRIGVVMTTNLTLEELRGVIGDRIFDRMLQSAVAREMTGQSRRKEKREVW